MARKHYNRSDREAYPHTLTSILMDKGRLPREAHDPTGMLRNGTKVGKDSGTSAW